MNGLLPGIFDLASREQQREMEKEEQEVTTMIYLAVSRGEFCNQISNISLLLCVLLIIGQETLCCGWVVGGI